MDGRVLDESSPLSQIAKMPNLKKLRSKGASFVNTYVTSPQCVPSRTTMAVGLRNHQIHVWDNSRGIVAVDGDPTELDHVCVSVWGEAECARIAGVQQAPSTFVDQLHHGGLNISLFGKLHIGAGLDRYAPPSDTNAFPFWGSPVTDAEAGFPAGKPAPGQPASGSSSKTIRFGRYHTRGALIPRNITGHNITRTLTVPDDVAVPLVPTDYLTIDLCTKGLAEGRLSAAATVQQFMYCSILVPHPPYLTNSTFMAMIDKVKSDASLPSFGPLDEVHPADHLMIL
jgi:hypothetical protein